MRTYSLKAKEVETTWHVVDADGQPLGRLASHVALLLRGKHRPTFTPHMDNGDFVIVVNASKVRLTGSKAGQKTYYRHTGYPGGLKETILDKLLPKRPHPPARSTANRRPPARARRREGVRMSASERYYAGTGRRKTSVARVRLYPGAGDNVINDRTFEDVFPRVTHRYQVMQPQNVTETVEKFHVQAKVAGGGGTTSPGA